MPTCKVVVQTAVLLLWVLVLTGCGAFRQGANKAPALEESLVRARYLIPPRRVAAVLPKIESSNAHEVAARLKRFTGPERRTIEIALSRRNGFAGKLERILRDEGLPEEVLAVALIESHFDARARSPAGARGIWQFMKPTAQIYGLEVGFFEDQRTDPVLSTIAAARHLRDLYRAFRDWPLVFAAYNAGSAAVDRAVARGQSSDFWSLARRGLFHRQTIDYVPKCLAAVEILRDLRGHGFGHLEPPVQVAMLRAR